VVSESVDIITVATAPPPPLLYHMIHENIFTSMHYALLLQRGNGGGGHDNISLFRIWPVSHTGSRKSQYTSNPRHEFTAQPV